MRLEPHPDRFGALVRAIVGQQISTKAAASINTRLLLLSGDRHHPGRLLETGETELRAAGLSSAKARYVLNLAEAVATGKLPLDEFDDSWDDQTIIQALVAVKGIGVWTAEMFLIFALNRPDVFSVGDLGLRMGLRDRHGLDEVPKPRDCHALAEIWRPYRSIASWYLWKGKDTPQVVPAAPALASEAVRKSQTRLRSKVMTFDLILSGGWVIDGSGGPPFRADVALIDTMIAEVGRLETAEAARVIDVAGLYVVPGFIDAHVHGDLILLADPVHLPALRQGVTTYLIGQDGSSFAPAGPATLDYMRRYTAGFNGNPPGLSYDWRTVDEYLARFDRRVAINVAYLIPNGNIRMEVMGLDPRPARDDELVAMQELVREGMDAGAIGLSTGLDYIPSRYADAREIAALCEPIVAQNGVYVTHMRAYGPRAALGMREVYDIARTTGVPAHISHYNGRADLLLPLIDAGRALGLDLTFDTYPYLAASTILGMVALPPWVQEGGIDATTARLREPGIRARLHSEWFSGATPYALENITVAMAAHPDWKWAEGQTVTAAAHEAKRPPGDFVCDILAACDMAVGIVGMRPAIEPSRTCARSCVIRRTWQAPTASMAGAFRTRAAGVRLPVISAITRDSLAITPGRRRSPTWRRTQPAAFV